MLGGVTCHMLPHLPVVPQLYVNRPWTASTDTLVVRYYDEIPEIFQEEVLKQEPTRCFTGIL